MIRGLDVSDVQGSIPWSSLVQLGIHFVYAKGAEGDHAAPDPKFLADAAGARAAGLVVGAYLFPYPLPEKPGAPLHDPVAQAQHHFAIVGGMGSRDGELPPMVDAEWPAPQDWAKWGCSAAQLRAWLLTYLGEVERLWARTPVMYTYPSWAASVGFASEPRFARYPLWLADYPKADTTSWPSETESFPTLAPWPRAQLVQFEGGSMRMPNGVPVDYDIFLGDQDAFVAFARITDSAGLAAVLANVTADRSIAGPIADIDLGPGEPPPAAA